MARFGEADRVATSIGRSTHGAREPGENGRSALHRIALMSEPILICALCVVWPGVCRAGLRKG